MPLPLTCDVTDATFATAVLEESTRRTVVVDFWAPWCGPCRVLGPVLERLAAADGGAWLLAKLNVDQSPETSARFHIQGIPAVKAFRDGQEVADFVGALPESQVRQFLDGLAPDPSGEWLARAEAALARGQVDEARSQLSQGLAVKPSSAPLLLAMAKVELTRGQPKDAAALLQRIDAALSPKLASEVAAVRLQVRASLGAGGDIGRAQQMAASGQFREALETLLSLVARHRRGPEGEEARKAMLELFEVVGRDSELGSSFLTRLAQELYR